MPVTSTKDTPIRKLRPPTRLIFLQTAPLFLNHPSILKSNMPFHIRARSCSISASKSAAQSPSTPFGSTAGRPRFIYPTPLIALPPELLIKIFSHLGNLDYLFSTILTCRRFFDVFQGAQRPLIQSTFARYVRLKSRHNVYKGLIQLRRVIQRPIICRDVARHIFEIAWRVFRRNHLEELLIPFRKALAWSFALHNREFDAVY